MDEFEKNTQEEPKAGMWRNMKELISGRVLTNKKFQGYVGYVFFLFFIAIFYIGYRYNMENIVRQNKRLDADIKSLHAEYVTKSMTLMKRSKRSEIAKQVAERGLTIKEPNRPPRSIVVE